MDKHWFRYVYQVILQGCTLTKNWSILKNGNFTKLLILILLAYALGTEGIRTVIGLSGI